MGDMIPIKFRCPKCHARFITHKFMNDFKRDNKLGEITDEMIIKLCPVCSSEKRYI